MKKYIAWTLILVTLLLAACRPVGTQPTDPDNIVGTATPTTQPTEPQPTEPQPTEPKPTEPKPTEPTVPLGPDGFPADLNTDGDVVAQFQKLLDNDSWYTQALFMEYDDPTTIRLNDFLFCGSMNWPYEHATQEEREALRKQLGVPDEEEWWGDWESMDPATMDEVLQTVFGLSLADFPESELQYIPFLESTGRYYYGRTDSSLVWNVSVVGIRELENGNVEVYYTCDFLYPENGVVTLMPDGDGHIVLSNKGL